MSEKTKKRPELPEGAVGWAPVNSDGKVVGPVQEDPDAPKKKEAARKEAAKAVLSSRKKSGDPEKDKKAAQKGEEDGEKKLLSEDPSKLSDEALSAAEKASQKALKDDKYGENGQKLVDAVKGEKAAREEKVKQEQGEASAAHAADISEKAAVAKEEREAKAKESLGPTGEEVRENVEKQKALPGTAAARLLATLNKAKSKDKTRAPKEPVEDPERDGKHKKKLELSNGVSFTMDYSNVIDLASANPAGQLAFRYKHGWILINPGIPSRGRMGGGLARKHGVKSGTTTKGHFEKNSNGKGAKFVATSTGHATIAQQLKATKQKFQEQLFQKAQAKEDRALQRDVKKMKQHVAEEVAVKASAEAAQASLDALTAPSMTPEKVAAHKKAYELHTKAQTLNADAGLLTPAAKHSDAALVQQKNAHSAQVLLDKAEALKEKKAKEKAEEEAKAEKAKQELQAELGKKAKEKYKKASDLFAAASVAEDKAVKSKKVEDFEKAAEEFQKAANEFTKGGKLAESAGEAPGLYNGLAEGMKNKVKNLKEEAKKQAESDKVLAELFDEATVEPLPVPGTSKASAQLKEEVPAKPKQQKVMAVQAPHGLFGVKDQDGKDLMPPIYKTAAAAKAAHTKKVNKEAKKKEASDAAGKQLLGELLKPKSDDQKMIDSAIDKVPDELLGKLESLDDWKQYFGTTHTAYKAIFGDQSTPEAKADADKKAKAAVDATQALTAKFSKAEIATINKINGDMMNAVSGTKPEDSAPASSKYDDIAGVDNPYMVKPSGNKQADGAAIKTLYEKFSDEPKKEKGDQQLKAIVAMKAAFVENHGEKWSPADYQAGEVGPVSFEPAPTPKKTGPSAPPAESAIRAAAHLKATGTVLGSHGAKVMTGKSGKKYLVKPQEKWQTDLDVAGITLQQKLGMVAPSVKALEINGKSASSQEMLDADPAFPGGFDPSKLSEKDHIAIQKQMAIDLMIGNHDSHENQWLRTKNGDLVSIDMGQAFKFGVGHNADYKPSGNVGEPIYAKYLASKPKMQMEAAKAAVDLSKMSKAQLKTVFGLYALSGEKAGKLPGGQDEKQFLAQLKAHAEQMPTHFDNQFEGKPAIGAPKVDGTAKKAEQFSKEDFKVSLPGPGMYADGNAIKALLKQMQNEPAGPKEDAMMAAYQDAKDAFKVKHGKNFDPGAVSDSGASAPFVPQLGGGGFFDAAKAEGYKHPDYAEDVTKGYKPKGPALKAVKVYVGSSTMINAQLRKYGPTGGSQDENIREMDRAFAEAPGAFEDLVTIRKMNGNGQFPAFPPPMDAGSEYIDDAYGSTSKSTTAWSGDVLMEVRIPKGTKVLDINHHDAAVHGTQEQEVLLPRGVTYRVVSDEQTGGDYSKQRKIVVEVVSHAAEKGK